MMTLAYKSDSNWNETLEKKSLIKHLFKYVVLQMRLKESNDLQMDIHENGGSITPAHLNYTDACASYVKGRTMVPLNNWGGAEAPPYL